MLRVRDHLAGSPFLALLPDNLFTGGNPTSLIVEAYRASGLATVLLAEIPREATGTKGATGRAKVRRAEDDSWRVVDVADKSTGRFDTAGLEKAVTPIGRMAFPAAVFDELEEIGRQLECGAELDDVPLLQRLARRNALAGVICPARFFDVGVPEGYREAVATFPACA